MERKKFNEIYDTYSKRLYNYALWLTRNTDACNDIIQAVFIKVWNQKKVFSIENELEAWLYKVTRNACMDFFRRCSRYTRFRLRYKHETPICNTESDENKSVWNMLDSLKERERTVLYLHFKSGYSYKKIAEVLVIKESAVRVTAFRAMEKLRHKCAKDFL